MTEFNYKQRSNTDDYRKGWDLLYGQKESSSEEPAKQPTPPESEEGLPEET